MPGALPVKDGPGKRLPCNDSLERKEASRVRGHGHEPGALAWRAGLVCREEGDDFAQLGADASHGFGYGIGPLPGLIGIRLGNGLRLRATVSAFKGLASTGQRVAFAMDESFDFERQLHFAAAIEALAGSAFVGLELGKLSFPETKDIGFYGADAGYVADLEVQTIRDGGRLDNALAGEICGHFSPEESAVSLAWTLLSAQYRDRLG